MKECEGDYTECLNAKEIERQSKLIEGLMPLAIRSETWCYECSSPRNQHGASCLVRTVEELIKEQT